LVDKPSVARFLERGLLPDNLPPFITSVEFVGLTEERNYEVTAKVTGRPSPFNSSKRGFQRRAFGISHPVFIRDAALFFRKHSADLQRHFARAVGSESAPIFDRNGVRAYRFTPHSKLPAIRLKKLAKHRFCLVTDVSRCFPSIYTHSIPWALHGKAAAKKDRDVASAKVFGNRLDYIFRQSQDGQTIGLPVGSDTSRLTAEIILAAVDRVFQEDHGDDGYIRHVDDFWIGGTSHLQCEERLHGLRSKLSDYGLDVNEQKTRIIPTSSVISEVWPYDLDRQLELALNDLEPNEARIVSLLGAVVEQSSKAQDDGIVRFFLRRLDSWRQWDDHWDLLEPFLAHCAVQFPHSFDYVARVIAWRKRRDREINRPLWWDVTREVLASAAAMGRDSEVLWALWLAKELDEEISSALAESITNNNGPLVVGVLAHFYRHGLVSGRSRISSLWSRVESGPLAGREWPLSLELTYLDAKPPPSIDMGGPEALKLIFNEGCSLVSWNAVPKAFLTEDNEVEENPDSAFERLGMDYDDDDDDDDDIDLSSLPDF